MAGAAYRTMLQQVRDPPYCAETRASLVTNVHCFRTGSECVTLQIECPNMADAFVDVRNYPPNQVSPGERTCATPRPHVPAGVSVGQDPTWRRCSRFGRRGHGLLHRRCQSRPPRDRIQVRAKIERFGPKILPFTQDAQPQLARRVADGARRSPSGSMSLRNAFVLGIRAGTLDTYLVAPWMKVKLDVVWCSRGRRAPSARQATRQGPPRSRSRLLTTA